MRWTARPLGASDWLQDSVLDQCEGGEMVRTVDQMR